MREPWTELQVSCESPADVLSKSWHIWRQIAGSLLQSYLEARGTTPPGASFWVRLHTVEVALTPSSTPLWSLCERWRSHRLVSRVTPPPLGRRRWILDNTVELVSQNGWRSSAVEWHWSTFVLLTRPCCLLALLEREVPRDSWLTCIRLDKWTCQQRILCFRMSDKQAPRQRIWSQCSAVMPLVDMHSPAVGWYR